MASLSQPRLTFEEYLAAEVTSERRREFFAGEVFEMEAASLSHQQVQAQTHLAIGTRLKTKPCKALLGGTRVGTASGRNGLHTYPDLVIVCGPIETWDTDPNGISNPKVIIEILSPATKDYDRGTKFELYRALPSLADYVNIHLDAPYIEHHTRQPNGSWLMSDIRGLASVLRLESAGIEVPFAEIYEDLEFPNPVAS